MSCDNCIQINPIPTCSTTWVIDGVSPSHEGSALTFLITNFATGGTISGETGEVAADGSFEMDAPSELMNHPYLMKFFQSDMEEIEVTIGDETSCCIAFDTIPLTVDSVTFSTTQCNV